jgi:hypothetical protein
MIVDDTIDEVVSWQNGKLSKQQVGGTASWRNGKLTKWH